MTSDPLRTVIHAPELYLPLPPLEGRFDDVCPPDPISESNVPAGSRTPGEFDLTHIAVLGYN